MAKNWSASGTKLTTPNQSFCSAADTVGEFGNLAHRMRNSAAGARADPKIRLSLPIWTFARGANVQRQRQTGEFANGISNGTKSPIQALSSTTAAGLRSGRTENL
jgi:hypothetical protein